MKFYINETVDQYYHPCEILLDETRELNEIADIMQKKKGRLPLFDDSGEYNPDDWYNFYLECSTRGVKKLWFEYGLGGEYCDEIKLTKFEKKIAFENVCDYFGGLEEYKRYVSFFEEEEVAV